MLVPVFQVEAVVEGEFLAFHDVALGAEPDAVAGLQGLAVGIAGMVEQAGGVLGGAAVQVLLVVQRKDVHRGHAGLAMACHAGLGAALGLGFGDPFASVLQDLRVLRDVPSGEDATGVNGGPANDVPGWGGRGFGHEKGQ